MNFYYIIIVVNLLHVSVTCCGHFQEGVFKRYPCAVCVVSLLSHITLSQIILSIFYILTYIVNHIFKT